MNAPAALFNGAQVPDLAFHRGLNYGDGVFRTCFIYDSQVIDITDQIRLLSSDSMRLGLAPASLQSLEKEAVAMAQGQARAVLKILLLRAGAARGYRSDAVATDRLLCRYPAPMFPAAAWERGVKTFRSPFRLAAQPALAGIKHLNRLEQVLASRDWQEDADEMLLSDDSGRPVCGTRTNLFWVRGGTLHTPALERCGVAGLMRSKVLALAGALQLPVRVADGGWDDVESADEVFLTNSLVGVWPVATLGSRRYAAPGVVTARLSARLNHPRLANA